MIFDCHAHTLKSQDGGILIALEGLPKFDDTFDNRSLKDLFSSLKNEYLLSCYYVDKTFPELYNNDIVKYHARREKYTPSEIIEDIKRRNPKLCIIDTLNQPDWQPNDYWKIVAGFPKIQFILPHAGGYDIIDFLKICDFNKNVWLDFSLTQEYFGWCGDRERLNNVADIIDYCLASKKISSKILFGSDEPFFSQETALDKYRKLKNSHFFLEDNFIRLLQIIS